MIGGGRTGPSLPLRRVTRRELAGWAGGPVVLRWGLGRGVGPWVDVEGLLAARRGLEVAGDRLDRRVGGVV